MRLATAEETKNKTQLYFQVALHLLTLNQNRMPSERKRSEHPSHRSPLGDTDSAGRHLPSFVGGKGEWVVDLLSFG